MPHVGEMPGPAARNNEQSIDANVVAVTHIARREALGRRGDPPQAPLVERESSGVLACTGLNLHEGDGAASSRNDVDLTASNPCTSREDPPAMDPQIPARSRLGAAAALFGSVSVHFARSRARA